jgi:hypothetical protein
MKFLLLLSFSNLTLSSPTVYDIFIFSLERYLIKLIIGFSLASRLWYLFQIIDLGKRDLWYGARVIKMPTINQEY